MKSGCYTNVQLNRVLRQANKMCNRERDKVFYPKKVIDFFIGPGERLLSKTAKVSLGKRHNVWVICFDFVITWIKMCCEIGQKYLSIHFWNWLISFWWIKEAIWFLKITLNYICLVKQKKVFFNTIRSRVLLQIPSREFKGVLMLKVTWWSRRHCNHIWGIVWTFEQIRSS